VPRTHRLERVLDAASRLAAASGVEAIGVEHVFLASLQDKRSIPSQVADDLGIRDALISRIEAVLLSEMYRTPTTTIEDQ
jgi:ATP-dependent Clp protease ATP-binding subunit ClpA